MFLSEQNLAAAAAKDERDLRLPLGPIHGDGRAALEAHG